MATFENTFALSVSDYLPCQPKLYPKVVGGSLGATTLRKIDVISSSQDAIVGGETSDQNLH